MPAVPVLTGLSSNYALPGNYLEILFAQGPSSGFAGQRTVLLMGNKTTAGSGTVGTMVYGPDTSTPALSEQDVINITGTGSEIHRDWMRAQKVGQNDVSIYFVIVAESVGSAASKQFTLLNVPSTAGNVRTWVGDEFVDYGYAAGDALASITTGIVAAINGKTRWAVTAAQTTSSTSNDSYTITARQKGPRGNWIRAMATISAGNGSTPNTTLTGSTDAFLTGGTTADDNTTALATIASARYYYIASAAEDATQLGALVSQVGSLALPTTGNRQRVFAGSVDTQANVDAIAAGLNNSRAELYWQKNSLWTPGELAAHFAALASLYENSGNKPLCNFVSFPRNDTERASWGPPAPRDQTAWPIPSVQNVALLNGVSPIAVNAKGATYLVDRITTHCLNGSNPDYRIRDAHKVTICDFFGDDLVQKENDQLGGKNLTDDVKVGDPNQPPSDTTTPNRYRDLVYGLINDYGPGGKSLLQKTALTKNEMIGPVRDPSNSSRLSVSIPLYPVDVLKQTAALVQQVG